MKTFILLAVLFVTLQVTFAAECQLDDLEDNAQKVMGYLTHEPYRYPVTDKDFQKYCKDIKETVRYTKDFAKNCLKGIRKTFISVFSYSTNQSNKKYCGKKNSKTRKDIISFGACMNNNKKTSMDCNLHFVNKLNVTNSIKNEKDKLPYMCCLVSDLKRCILQGIEKRKDPLCTEEALDSFEKYMDGTMGNLMNTICTDSDDNFEKCEKLIKAQNVKLRRVNYKTFLPLFFEIFENL